MNTNKIKSNLVFAVFIVISFLITMWSINFGMNRSYSGEDTILWLHVVAFVATAVCVLLAIFFKLKLDDK